MNSHIPLQEEPEKGETRGFRTHPEEGERAPRHRRVGGVQMNEITSNIGCGMK
jgi:hypothetical protein